jgi:hypothetical protein
VLKIQEWHQIQTLSPPWPSLHIVLSYLISFYLFFGCGTPKTGVLRFRAQKVLRVDEEGLTFKIYLEHILSRLNKSSYF